MKTKTHLCFSYFQIFIAKCETVVLEPLTGFYAASAGFRKDGGKTSVMQLTMLEEKPIYEKEIPPGTIKHVIRAIKKNSKDKCNVKRMLGIIYRNLNNTSACKTKTAK